MYYNLNDTTFTSEYSSALSREQGQRGFELFKQRKYAEAIAQFRRAVTAPNVDAACYLGYCHSQGLGVERNLFEALRWYGFHGYEREWVRREINVIWAEIKKQGLVEQARQMSVVDSDFGEIKVYFSDKIESPQVRFNAGYIAVTLHISNPYDEAVAVVCRRLVSLDFSRMESDYGRIDENFRLNYPLFKLSVERGNSNSYTYRCEGNKYTIVTPQDVDFSRVCTREYIIGYGYKLLKRAAEKYLSNRLAEIAEKTGLSYSQCRFSSARDLGSYQPCSGIITLKYTLIKSSAEFVDMVLLHELVHSKCTEHSDKFYDLMRYYGGDRVVEVDKNNIGFNPHNGL